MRDEMHMSVVMSQAAAPDYALCLVPGYVQSGMHW